MPNTDSKMILTYKVKHHRDFSHELALAKKVAEFAICTTCDESKPVVEFYPNRARATGRSNECKLCVNKRACIWAKKDRKLNPEKYRLKDRASKAKNPHYYWALSSMSNHKKKGLTMEITTSQLTELAKSSSMCKLCEVPLKWGYGTKKITNESPTLDRINNEKVVSIENTWIICYSCNRSKGARTLEEFINYCKKIAEGSIATPKMATQQSTATIKLN